MAIQPSAKLIKAIRAYKKGDSQAFDEIYNASAPYLNKCILNVVNRTAPGASGELVADILQDTCMTVAEKLNTLEKEDAYFQWAGQIATNHALRTWSKEARKQELTQAEDDLVYDLADDRFIPEDILENKEKQQLIRNMLQQLPTGQYLCVVEYFYNGLKETEVAQKLGMPLGTVKTNLSRAKKKLRQIIGDHEKKHGVKLYSMSGLLAVMLWQDVKFLYAGSTAAVFGGVSAGESVVASGTAAATGVTAKVCAVIAAAAVTVGGLTVGLMQSNRSRPDAPVEATRPVQTAPLETEPTVPSAAEPTVPVIPESQHIVLTAQELAYMNRLVYSFELGITPTRPYAPYDRGGIAVDEFVCGCAGTQGLLRGEKTKNGLVVQKADLEAFFMDTLGRIGDTYLESSGDTYLLRHYGGDREIPIFIHDILALNDQQVQIVTPKGYQFIFERNTESQYGWILIKGSDTCEKIAETDVMRTAIFQKGIVLPEGGASALESISGPGELSSSAAFALVEQYLQAQGVQPYRLSLQDWGLIANGYYTYKIFTVDEAGIAGDCFIVGTPDAALFIYDEINETMTEIDWLP